MPAPGTHPILLPSCAVCCGKYYYGRHWHRRQEAAPAARHWAGRVEAQPVGGSALHWQVLPCSAWQWEERTYRRLRDGAGSHAALAASSGCKSALMERDAQPVGRETRHCPAPFLPPACPAQARGETREGVEKLNCSTWGNSGLVPACGKAGQASAASPTPLARCSQDHPLPLQNQAKSFPKSARESVDVPCNASGSLVTMPCACAGFPGKAQQTFRRGPGSMVMRASCLRQAGADQP